MDQPTGEGPLTFAEVLDTLELAGRSEKLNLGSILDSFGRRAFGPFLLVPALIAVLPLVGALPGVSLATAGVEVIVALQLALGERRLHLPRRIRSIGIPRRALAFSVRTLRPMAHTIGRLVRPRLRSFTNGGARLAVGALALILALLMLVGALVPGGIVLPALGMIILGLGLTSQDGVLILVSLTLALGSIGLGLWWLL